jgi:anti-sigma B factor antagonist
VAFLPKFRIETHERGSGTTIKLAGELDNATCTELLERFEQVAAAPDFRALVLDLEEVSFIDSSGMRAIIALERRAKEDGLALALMPPPPAVTELLRITGITDRLPLAPRASGAPAAAPFIERVEIELARDADAPARARVELREAVAGHLADGGTATATLLTSELVTNAVLHPKQGVGGSIGLRITTYRDRIRVDVTDAGSGFEPGSVKRRPYGAGGHGLFVVAGLASRWGTTRPVMDGGQAFCVWFELDSEAEPGAAGQDQFSTPSRSQQYSSRHSLASSMHLASESQGSTVSNA